MKLLIPILISAGFTFPINGADVKVKKNVTIKICNSHPGGFGMSMDRSVLCVLDHTFKKKINVTKGSILEMTHDGTDGNCGIQFQNKKYEIGNCAWLEGYTDRKTEFFEYPVGSHDNSIVISLPKAYRQEEIVLDHGVYYKEFKPVKAQNPNKKKQCSFPGIKISKENWLKYGENKDGFSKKFAWKDMRTLCSTSIHSSHKDPGASKGVQGSVNCKPSIEKSVSLKGLNGYYFETRIIGSGLCEDLSGTIGPSGYILHAPMLNKNAKKFGVLSVLFFGVKNHQKIMDSIRVNSTD